MFVHLSTHDLFTLDSRCLGKCRTRWRTCCLRPGWCTSYTASRRRRRHRRATKMRPPAAPRTPLFSIRRWVLRSLPDVKRAFFARTVYEILSCWRRGSPCNVSEWHKHLRAWISLFKDDCKFSMRFNCSVCVSSCFCLPQRITLSLGDTCKCSTRVAAFLWQSKNATQLVDVGPFVGVTRDLKMNLWSPEGYSSVQAFTVTVKTDVRALKCWRRPSLNHPDPCHSGVLGLPSRAGRTSKVFHLSIGSQAVCLVSCSEADRCLKAGMPFSRSALDSNWRWNCTLYFCDGSKHKVFNSQPRISSCFYLSLRMFFVCCPTETLQIPASFFSHNEQIVVFEILHLLFLYAIFTELALKK